MPPEGAGYKAEIAFAVLAAVSAAALFAAVGEFVFW